MDKIEELYEFIVKLEEDTLEQEEKRIEKLFGRLTDEQINYLTETRYKFFKLGFEIKRVLEDFKK